MFNLVRQFFGGSRTQPKRRPTMSPPFVAQGFPPRKVTTSRGSATDLLDNPSLKLDSSQDEGFDPYNTGTFNRSGSWERINKRRNS